MVKGVRAVRPNEWQLTDMNMRTTYAAVVLHPAPGAEKQSADANCHAGPCGVVMVASQSCCTGAEVASATKVGDGVGSIVLCHQPARGDAWVRGLVKNPAPATANACEDARTCFLPLPVQPILQSLRA